MACTEYDYGQGSNSASASLWGLGFWNTRALINHDIARPIVIKIFTTQR
jgi:hypothetical protein